MINIAIFASGGGSNAATITKYFLQHPHIRVAMFVTNNAASGVISLGNNHDIPTKVLTKKQLSEADVLLPLLQENQIDYIVLAGFLLKIPDFLIAQYQEKIFNIHPALLPKYGGKGMYGHHVHETVFNASERVTGMTVHLVNENYDEGRILFQAACLISKDMNPDQIAHEVLKLEHAHYARVIEKYITEFQH